MKISTRDKKILLMFFGIAFFVVGYFFGYKPLMEEASQIEAANVPLQQRLDELLELAQNKEFYISETNDMEQQIQDYCTRFPSAVKAEDGIVLSQNMEKALDISVSSVGIGTPEFIDSLDGETANEGMSVPEETLSEQANEKTQEQLNELEGNSTTGETAQNDTGALGSAGLSPSLYRVSDSMQYTCTYQSLKDLVKYLSDQSGRMTLDNINASFDASTGNLTGTMTVNMFFMTGIGKQYTSPDAGSVSYGTDNIFGTIEAPVNMEPVS